MLKRAIALTLLLSLCATPLTVRADAQEYDDLDLLMRIVWLEARGESDLGQQMVVQVILHRLNAGTWGDTLHSVIYADGQFTPAKSIPVAEPGYREFHNVMTVLNAIDPLLPEWVQYFQAGGYPSWEGYDRYEKIGNHYFGGFK